MVKVDYKAIELTPEETEAAILEGKKVKYFREKHRHYWEQLQKNETNQADDTIEESFAKALPKANP